MDHVRGYAAVHGVNPIEVIQYCIWRTFFEYAVNVGNLELCRRLEGLFGQMHQGWENADRIAFISYKKSVIRF